jgi:hypothetical protein
LSRKKGIRAIHLKEALFNIATKTTIFAEKNVITCNIAVTKYHLQKKEHFIEYLVLTSFFGLKGIGAKMLDHFR